MSATDQSALQAKAARRLVLTVRLSPQLIDRLGVEARKLEGTAIEIAGLLFGRAEDDLADVHTCRSFPEIDSSTGRSPQGENRDELFYSLMLASRTDPEVSGFDLIGWYTVRPTGGLHQSDIEFHERHFRRPLDVALIVRSEREHHLFELYTRSADGLLSAEAHRSGAVRLLTTSAVTDPVEVAMRGSVRDDFYLRAYEVGKALDNVERREHWKNTIQSTKEAALSVLWPKRAKPETSESSEESHSSGNSANAVIRRPSTEMDLEQAGPGRPTAAIVRRMQPVIADVAPVSTANPMQRIPAEEPPGSPAVRAQRKEGGVPWLSSAIVFMFVASATFGMILLLGLPAGNRVSEFLRVLVPSSGLQLRAEGQGDRILLSWNRLNPVVRSAQQGVLEIVDGSQHRDVRLDAGQVANGSVLYRPASADVTFRLEVHGDRGATIAESTRVLDGVKPPDSAKSSSTADASTRTARDETAGRVSSGPRNSTGERTGLSDLKPQGTSNMSTARTATPSTVVPPPALTNGTPDSGAAAPSNAERTSTETGAPRLRASDNVLTLLSPPALQDTFTPAGSDSKIVTWDEPVLPKPTLGDKIVGPSKTPSAQAQAPIQAQPGTPVYIAPVPIRQVLPNMKAFGPGGVTSVQEVEVEVRVDKTGHVEEAHIARQGGKLKTALVRATLAAATQWVFQPAMLHGVPIASEHTIVFQFHPAAR